MMCSEYHIATASPAQREFTNLAIYLKMSTNVQLTQSLLGLGLIQRLTPRPMPPSLPVSPSQIASRMPPADAPRISPECPPHAPTDAAPPPAADKVRGLTNSGVFVCQYIRLPFHSTHCFITIANIVGYDRIQTRCLYLQLYRHLIY